MERESLDSYISLNIVSVIQSDRLRWTDHVARMEDNRKHFENFDSKTCGQRLSGMEDNIINKSLARQPVKGHG